MKLKYRNGGSTPPQGLERVYSKTKPNLSKSELFNMLQSREMAQLAASMGYEIPDNTVAGQANISAYDLENTEGSAPDSAERFWENVDRSNINQFGSIGEAYERFIKDNPDYDSEEGKKRFYDRAPREMSSISYRNSPKKRDLIQFMGPR